MVWLPPPIHVPSDQIDTHLFPGASVSPQAVPEVDSWSLQEFFGLTSSSARDVVLITIDFANLANIKIDLLRNLDSEVGLAILNTKDINLDSLSSAKLISTYSFASGSSDYQERAREKFLFGESVALTQNDMLERVKPLIPPNRQVVFIGHSIRTDLRASSVRPFKRTKSRDRSYALLGLAKDIKNIEFVPAYDSPTSKYVIDIARRLIVTHKCLLMFNSRESL